MPPPAKKTLAGTMAPVPRSTSDQTVDGVMGDGVAGPALAASTEDPAAGDSLMPNPGTDAGNELTDAKIAAAEARTDAKFRDVDVKFERVLGEMRLGFQELRTGFQELRTDITSFKGEVGIQLAGMQTKADARSNMQWIIGTLAALMVAVAGLIVGSFQTGVSVFQTGASGGVLSPRPSPLAVPSARQ
jgi:hypothetical protein